MGNQIALTVDENGSSSDAEILGERKLATQTRQEVPRTANGSSEDVEILEGEQKPAVQSGQEA